MPGTIQAVDYDFYSYSRSGEGLTYHNRGTTPSTLYRTDGTVEIEAVGGAFVVTDMEDGEWMNYTFTLPREGYYKILVDAEVVKEGASFYVAVDNGTPVGQELAVTEGFGRQEVGVLKLAAGAGVLRLTVKGTNRAVRLRSIVVEETSHPDAVADYVWNSRDYVSPPGEGSILTDRSDRLLVLCGYASDMVPAFTVEADGMAYRVPSGKLYLAIHGRNLNMVMFKGTSYRLPGETDDEVKDSASGQASTWSVRGCGSREDEQLFVWQLDSSANRRIEPLLGACYEEGDRRYRFLHVG